MSEGLANVVKHAQASRADVAARAARMGRSWSRWATTGSAVPSRRAGSGLRGLADRVEAIGGVLCIESPHERLGYAPARGDPVRVVIADDSVLFLEGLARVLADGGFDVAAQAGVRRRASRPPCAVARPRARDRRRPHAADADRRGHARSPGDPGTSIPTWRCSSNSPRRSRSRNAFELFSEHPAGFGYLLKDRVLDVHDFYESARRVGSRRHRVDPDVAGQLMGRRRERDPLAGLTPREREVLGADGGRPVEPGHLQAAGWCSARRPSSPMSTRSSASSTSSRSPTTTAACSRCSPFYARRRLAAQSHKAPG